MGGDFRAPNERQGFCLPGDEQPENRRKIAPFLAFDGAGDHTPDDVLLAR